jgi:tetratricopeptide (TPR) repeat protein
MKKILVSSLIVLVLAFSALAQDIQALYDQSKTQYDNQQYQAAISGFKRIIDKNPDIYQAHYYLGLCYYDLKKYPEAIDEFEETIRLKPNLSYVYIDLGNAYDSSGNYDAAVTAYEKSISLNPKDYQAYLELGVAHNAQKNFDEAAKVLKNAVKYKSDSYRALAELGIAYTGQKLFPDAIAVLKSSIALKPDYARAYFNLGNAYYNDGRYAESVPYYKKATELTPDGETAQLYLADAYLNTKQNELAVITYKKVLVLNAENTEAIYGLGLAYYNLNNKTALKQQIEALKPLDDGKADKLQAKYDLLPTTSVKKPPVKPVQAKPIAKTAQRIKDERDVAAMNDFGFDGALVTGVSSIRETASKTGKILLAVKRNDVLSLSEQSDTNGFYRVVDEKSGVEGWIDGKTVVIKLTGNTENSGPSLNDDGEADNVLADPVVSITNSETKTTLKMRLNGTLYLIPPQTTKVVSVRAGKFTYYGWSPGIRPATGSSTLEKGRKYSWNFKINRR